MMGSSRVLLAFGILAVLDTHTTEPLAQTSDQPAFEVISIKPRAPAPPGELVGSPSGFQPGGRYFARNTSLFNLIESAYRGNHVVLRAEQVVGGPSWLHSPLFDIDAKVGGELSPIPIPLLPTGAALLRSLLEDRFKLKAHVESRPLPVYVLLLAHSNGTLGPKLRPSLVDCQQLLEASRGYPPVPLPPPPAGRPQCGAHVPGATTMVLGGTTMEKLAAYLVRPVRSTVVDRTGLTGSYDVELAWGRESLTPSSGSTPEGPSIFTAVREQLGLKLELRREPMDVVVIDHVERPTDN